MVSSYNAFNTLIIQCVKHPTHFNDLSLYIRPLLNMWKSKRVSKKERKKEKEKSFFCTNAVTMWYSSLWLFSIFFSSFKKQTKNRFTVWLLLGVRAPEARSWNWLMIFLKCTDIVHKQTIYIYTHKTNEKSFISFNFGFVSLFNFRFSNQWRLCVNFDWKIRNKWRLCREFLVKKKSDVKHQLLLHKYSNTDLSISVFFQFEW